MASGRPAIGCSGFSNDEDYREPIFSEALSRTKSHKGARPNYVDWDPVLKPEFKKDTKPVQRPKSPEPLDFFKYEKDYDFNPQPVEVSSLATEQPEWYAGTDESFIGPVNVTWDGKSWPDQKQKRVNRLNQDSTTDENAYAPGRKCIGCVRN